MKWMQNRTILNNGNLGCKGKVYWQKCLYILITDLYPVTPVSDATGLLLKENGAYLNPA